MAKPVTFDGYTDQYTVDCERVLVTLLRGLGPWKESVYLVGGLTPRYLVLARPPAVPAHAGTLDVDIVIDLQILADTVGYSTLEDNLRRMRFERSTNDKGQKLSWRWQTRTEHGALMVVELLGDAPEIAGGKVEPLPTKGTISALNIPHSSIVFDLHQVTENQAELLNGAGTAIEQVKHANLVSFTCLKAFAFDQRFERKDAHDLVYCIEHTPEGLDSAAEMFRNALESSHGTVIWNALAILRNRFTRDQNAALGTLLNYWNNFDQPLLNCFDSITSPTCSLPVIPVIQQRPLFASHSGHPGKNHRATGGHREGKPELK